MLFLFIFSTFVRVYLFILVAYALLSWFPGAYQTRLGQWVTSLVEPVLRPFRRLPLQIAGMDFTILVVMLTIQFGSQFLLNILARLLLGA